MSSKRWGRLLRESVQEWSQDKSSRLAAALAYYTVFSLAPLLVIVIAIASFFFDQAYAREQITQQIQNLVGPQGAEAIGTVLDNANRPGENTSLIASLISVIILLFGATGVFVQLQDALNTIWNVEAKPQNAAQGFIRKRILSFAMLLTIGFLLIVSLVVSTAISALSGYLSSVLPGLDVLWQLLNIVISLGILTLLFALLFKYVPDVKIAWNDVWVGSLVTAVLFTMGKFALGVYLGNSSFGSAYGAAGSFILILAWVYYSAQILFFGAEVTQVYARRYGSQIVPDSHAVSTLPKSEESQNGG